MIKISKSNFPKFNNYLISALVGTLLGDSSLQTYTDGKTFRARFLQSDLHKDYLFHLYSLFKEYTSTPPKLSNDGLGNLR